MELDMEEERWVCGACPVTFLWDETPEVMAYGARGKMLAASRRN